MANISDFGKQHGIKSATALKNTLRGLLVFFKGALRYNLTQPHIKSDMQLMGLEESRADVMASKWGEVYVDLSRSIVGQTLEVNSLIDFEWKFGITASTDELEAVGTTFLQLKLVIDSGKGKEPVYMELSLPQFYAFLGQMEKAKAHLDLLSS